MIWEHVALDEAQDRSALEIKVLVEAVHAPDGDPAKRSVTIAGDTAQRLVFDNNFSGWAELLLQTGQPAIVRPLKLSYRSTAEVMVLAREILGPELGAAGQSHSRSPRARAKTGRAPRVRRSRRGGVAFPRRRAAKPHEPRAHREELRGDLRATPSRPTRVLRVACRRTDIPALRPDQARRVQLSARRRRHRCRAGQGPRVRLRRDGRRQRGQLSGRELGAPPAAHRRDARRAPAVAGLDVRALAADPASRRCATAGRMGVG